MNYKFSSPPHIKDKLTVAAMMQLTTAALAPAILYGIYLFGVNAALLYLTCAISCVITEAFCLKIMRSPVPLNVGGSLITGLLLAMTLSPSFPLWAAVIGSVVAIVVGKQLFGGLGHNIFNPALVGRAFLTAAFPLAVTSWGQPFSDALLSATPLGLLLGGIFLIYTRVINWRMPAACIGSTALFGLIFWLIDPLKYPSPLLQVLGGGLMLGAFFMATDPATSPMTKKGVWIFGIGTGLLVVLLKSFSGRPEGIMYSILIMNALTPVINRYTWPRIFGK